MAKPTSKKKKLLKVKKKKWVEVLAPRVFKEMSVGKTYVPDQSSAMGKYMKINLMNLTKDPKKQSINVSFKVDKLQGEKLGSKLMKYVMQPTAVRRLVRRSKERIDDSFIVKTKDNITIRVKPIIITRNSCSNAVKAAIRAKARQTIANEVAKLTFDLFIGQVLQRAFQKRVMDTIKKIQPIGITEIRSILVIEDKTIKSKEASEEEAPKEEVAEA